MSDICPIFVRYRVKFNETHYCPFLVNSFHSTLLTIYIPVVYRKYIKAVKCYIPLYFIVISRIPTESRVRRKLAVDRQRAFLVKGAVGNPIPVKASWPKKPSRCIPAPAFSAATRKIARGRARDARPPGANSTSSRHLSQILAEKPPDLVAGIHVGLCPTVLTADDLIQPDFNFRAALPGWLATTITVKHDGIAP